jgi:hypothetical protein
LHRTQFFFICFRRGDFSFPQKQTHKRGKKKVHNTSLYYFCNDSVAPFSLSLFPFSLTHSHPHPPPPSCPYTLVTNCPLCTDCLSAVEDTVDFIAGTALSLVAPWALLFALELAIGLVLGTPLLVLLEPLLPLIQPPLLVLLALSTPLLLLLLEPLYPLIQPPLPPLALELALEPALSTPLVLLEPLLPLIQPPPPPLPLELALELALVRQPSR